MKIKDLYEKLKYFVDKGTGDEKVYMYLDEFDDIEEIESISVINNKLTIGYGCDYHFQCSKCGENSNVSYLDEKNYCFYCEKCAGNNKNKYIQIIKV